jgi:hypothetical protein
MPRTGGGIYAKPFPDVTAGTTIASAVHNGIMADVETDLNAPRPVIAGGTGAVNALGARANLQVERSMQAVTNFDSHVWEMGSFVAVIGASAGPPSGGTTTEHFFGIAYGDAVNMFVEARSLTTGLNYVRRKTGTWSAWALDGGDKLSNTGGTITGNLQITGTLGVTGTTTLGTLNAGTTSVGALTSSTLNTGAITSTTINTNGNTITAGAINAGHITSTGLNTGDVKLTRSYAPTTGALYFGAGGSIYLHYDGSKFIFSGGNVEGTFNGTLNGNITGNANYANSAGSAGYATSAGSAPASGGNANYANSAGYADSAGYAGSAGSAPANGGTSSATRSLVTNDPSRTWSMYGTGLNLHIDDSSAGLLAAKFTAYGSVDPGTINLYMPYHTHTTNGVNATWTSDYILQFVSSIRYKTDVQDVPRDVVDKVMAFRPVTFRSKCPVDDPDEVHFGLIAEEVEAIEPRLVQYGHDNKDYVNERDEDGRVSKHYLREGAKKRVMGLDYNAIVALLLRKVQDQEERIALLETKLNQ